MWKRFWCFLRKQRVKVANLQRRCEGRSLRSLRIVLEDRFANRLEDRFANRLEDRFANRLANRFANCLLWRQFRFCFVGLSESSGAFSGSFALFLSAF